MSTSTYHDRFATELRENLPEGFTVIADSSLVVATYGTSILVGFVPNPRDKRAAVKRSDVLSWIETHSAKLRRDMSIFTAEAKEAGSALLEALKTTSVSR